MCIEGMPKRSNFSRLQLDHWVNSDGHMLLPTRTGFDTVIAHKVNKMFSFVAEQDGTITTHDGDGLVVTYKDGSTDKVGLGRSFVQAAGKTMPHNIVTDRSKGYKFKSGEVIAWNSFYFERDWLLPTQVAMYTGTPAIVAMRETPETYEDGSSISADFSAKSPSTVTHIREILIDYADFIEMQVKLGDGVSEMDVLARILPPGIDVTNMESDSLDHLSTSTPRAKYDGNIERIEHFYHGDTETASDSVKSIIKSLDRVRKKESAYTDEAETGSLLEPTYIGKSFVGKDNLLIRVYITHKDYAGAGSKTVFANANKSVPGKVFSGIYETVDGTRVDATLSYRGIMARVVLSPERLGILNMVVRRIGFNACKLYRK